jgi:hypothetical protein
LAVFGPKCFGGIRSSSAQWFTRSGWQCASSVRCGCHVGALHSSAAWFWCRTVSGRALWLDIAGSGIRARWAAGLGVWRAGPSGTVGELGCFGMYGALDVSGLGAFGRIGVTARRGVWMAAWSRCFEAHSAGFWHRCFGTSSRVLVPAFWNGAPVFRRSVGAGGAFGHHLEIVRAFSGQARVPASPYLSPYLSLHCRYRSPDLGVFRLFWGLCIRPFGGFGLFGNRPFGFGGVRAQRASTGYGVEVPVSAYPR